MKVAVIDVGFNSLKMVKYRVDPDGTVKPYGQLGVLAKLGEGLEKTGYLGSDQISRTVDSINLCRESATLEGIRHVLLIGTSPVREAANREDFLKRVQEETGMKMRVLAGDEEALYGALGAAKSVDAEDLLIFDLGGGSLEFAHVHKLRVRTTLSLPLGALKLTSTYAGKDGTFSKKARSRMAKRITQALPSKRELGVGKDAVLVGTGGTVRAMARFDQDERGYPLDKVHNYPIGFGPVKRMCREFLRLRPGDLDKIEAIGEGRSETIAAGTLVVRTLMAKLGARRLLVSTHGLRDGILSEFLGRASPADGMARREEIERILARPERNQGPTGGFCLLESLERNGLVSGREKKVLLMAVRRARSPEVRDADADSSFGVLMGEDMPLSHEDQLLAVLSVVRARRPRTANWLMKRYADVLLDDMKVVRKLGACVRLVEVLDRSRAQIRVAYSGGLRISVVDGEGPFPLELAKMAALGLSSAVRKPVTISASVKERVGGDGLVRVGG